MVDEDVEYTVSAIDKNRIEKVHILLLPSSDEEDVEKEPA